VGLHSRSPSLKDGLRVSTPPSPVSPRAATGVVFAVLVNFAVLVTPFVSGMPGMWVRQHCKVPQLCEGAASQVAFQAADRRSFAGKGPAAVLLVICPDLLKLCALACVSVPCLKTWSGVRSPEGHALRVGACPHSSPEQGVTTTSTPTRRHQSRGQHSVRDSISTPTPPRPDGKRSARAATARAGSLS
jgi:hypothetical protein